MIAEVWLWITLLTVGLFPLWDGRHRILLIARRLIHGRLENS